ncbi:hypothetical protein BZL41_14670 [Pseudomonas sp. PIC25]|uniref:hypothetical protein n=1 Tax=Pseudomonas sp. PIC25 TaxID=1958773 RepID=UPI000BCE4837|nr:hypothetical protein [Pseudomonas sp. PIC25]PAU60958.1 hypothetical protein BZL41_14670 [Pseudomonas sp. PIC25]
MSKPLNAEKQKFLGIWRRALALPALSDLSTELVSDWASQAGLHVLSATEKNVGAFRPIRTIVLATNQGAACFPKVPHENDSQWLANRKAADHQAGLWKKMEWFCPLWIAQGKISELLRDVEYRSKDESIKLFDYHTSTLYTLSFQAVCIAQLIPSSRSLADFAPIAREAYLAFYSGHRASSIAALIPVIEGALQRISGATASMPILDQVDRIIDRACTLAGRLHFENMWVPREYLTTNYLYGQDERIFVFETFRSWLKDSFFCRTGEYDGVTWLNRHLFAHGTSTEWQNSANFCRLVVALATLGVIESWHDESHRVSLFFPEMSEDSKLLWQQALLQAQAQFVIKNLEEKMYHSEGRTVPIMPTDDGVLLRKARLQDECINDLVRPLRNAGWSVEVGEPDDRALHVKVIARAEHNKICIALLYSCATENKLYRELAQSCDAILYLGAPYHQDQYAYGIDVHVGPVAGWQPPKAPSN